MLGGFANPQFQPYSSPVALAIYLQLPPFPGTGQRHILFDFGNDMYVLPGGLTLVGEGPAGDRLGDAQWRWHRHGHRDELRPRTAACTSTAFRPWRRLP